MPDLKGRHLHGERFSTSPSMDSSRRARLPGAVERKITDRPRKSASP